jgi:lipoprotein-anchoring transpeptidase ErfK/SrfK
MARVLSLGAVLLVVGGGPGVAQDWVEDLFGPDFGSPRRETPEKQVPEMRRDWGDYVRSGGARPVISPSVPPEIAFQHDFPANSIVIDTGARKLYYVLPDKRAYEYSIGVGREGFGWAGSETISRKQAWPDWHPPAEMRARDPRLPVKMTGGIRNPLGAMALYLGDTLYRIHGTNDPRSIGRAESSGCFRMLNSSVLHLASLVEVGTPVVVVSSLAGRERVTRAPNAPKELDASQTNDSVPEATSEAVQ